MNQPMIAALIMCAILAPNAGAQIPTATANDMLTSCQAPNNSEGRWDCYNFILGVAQTHDFMVEGMAVPRLYCHPKGVTIDQTRQVFIKWAKDHPQYLHQKAAPAFIASLKDAFPCLPEVEIIGPAR